MTQNCIVYIDCLHLDRESHTVDKLWNYYEVLLELLLYITTLIREKCARNAKTLISSQQQTWDSLYLPPCFRLLAC